MSMAASLRLVASVLALAAVGAVGGAGFAQYASAQQKPESILPPGFDDPSPAPRPSPSPRPSPVGPAPASPVPGATTAPAIPGAAGPAGTIPPSDAPASGANLPPPPSLTQSELDRLPSLEKLESLSTDELDQLLGLRPKTDIPPGARRALTRVGLLSVSEGGLPPAALANQSADLVRAALAGTRGPIVSRWGHILLRRALASRSAAPGIMDPVEFAALRVRVLNRIGEYQVARALVQDIDSANWSPGLTQEGLTAYIATGDITGACPAVRLQGSARKDGEWQMLQAICNAYAGESALAASQLDRALYRGVAPRIDVLLARRLAGAAGRGQRAVQIEWQNVEELNPWRFALANAVGEPVPDDLLKAAVSGTGGAYYDRSGALLPMLPASARAAFAGRAAREGILSADAMVDLFSAVFEEPGAQGPAADHARSLRAAYVAADPAARITAMRKLWDATDTLGGGDGYGARVLTAYAAARVPADPAYAGDADGLVASMLAAGLDRNALAWRDVVDEGSLAWALIVLSAPQSGGVATGDVQSFIGSDQSEASRKSAFLVAGLAGLGRISPSDASGLADDLGIDLARQTRWTRTIARAGEVGNPMLVALLAGLGMQGTGWDAMTPLHLYHITSALTRAGLEAEARMIAAEAVARG